MTAKINIVPYSTRQNHIVYTVAHLAWKKGVCRGRAAFDITFQHKTTFSLKTRNRPINFAILPNFGNPNCYFVYG